MCPHPPHKKYSFAPETGPNKTAGEPRGETVSGHTQKLTSDTPRPPAEGSQTVLLSIIVMNVYVELCHSLGVPVWLASLLRAAKRLRTDRARRKKVYRLLQRKLFSHGVGVKKGHLCQPTYVYPEEVKMLVRTAFPKDICDNPDPCHDEVVSITVEDLYKV